MHGGDYDLVHFLFVVVFLLLFVFCLFFWGGRLFVFFFLEKTTTTTKQNKNRSEINVQKAIGVIFQSKMLLVFGITFKGGIHAAMGVGAFAGMHPEMETHTYTQQQQQK